MLFSWNNNANSSLEAAILDVLIVSGISHMTNSTSCITHKNYRKIKMAGMKTSPGLVNFFIYNSTFGPKEGMVCDMIFKDYGLLRLQNLASFNIGVYNRRKSESFVQLV